MFYCYMFCFSHKVIKRIFAKQKLKISYSSIITVDRSLIYNPNFKFYIYHLRLKSVLGLKVCYYPLYMNIFHLSIIFCRGIRPRMSVLNMILKHLIVRLQSWSSEECGVPLHFHYSQVLKW